MAFEAIVLAVDVQKKRISLSIRAALAADEREVVSRAAAERAAARPEPGPRAAAPAPDAPLTTMAIALRKAVEEARKREAGGSS